MKEFGQMKKNGRGICISDPIIIMLIYVET